MAKQAQTRDAIQMLADDHRTVEALFEKYENARSPAARHKIVRQICEELTIHCLIEEQVFYPSVRPIVDDSMMDEAQRILADFLPLIDWQRFARQPLGARLAVHDFAGLVCGCGDRQQAVIALMASEADGAVARRLDIAGLAPGCYEVTQVDTITGARDTCRVHTHQDGTLVVLTMAGAHDLALAVTHAPDGC